MADLSDVETAITTIISALIYPGGISVPSVIGRDVKIYRGWPAPIGLNADLANQVSTVSIFSDPKIFRETTRYPRVWRQVSFTEPSLTVQSQGNTVTFGGFGSAGQVVGVRVAGQVYSLAPTATDSPASIAVAFSTLIPGSVAFGPALIVSSAQPVLGRVVGSGVSSLETRRQEQGFVVSVWCADPSTRDSLSSLIDSSLSEISWLEFTDGSAGQLRYHGSTVVDTAENANLYRRELSYTVDYPTIILRRTSAMLFGRTTTVAATVSTEVPAAPLPLLGALRFDAWYDPTDPIDQQCAAALSLPIWGDRLPSNATMIDGQVRWPLADQEVIDAEIAAAFKAGLSFWAFDSYSPDDGLSRALSLYLTSALRGQIQFCMLGQSSNWADPLTSDGYSSAFERDVAMMAEEGYLKVLGARPVYFVLDASAEQTALLPAGGVAQALAVVRQKALASGVGNPYIIWLSGAALLDYDNTIVARQINADAAGAYACPRLSGSTQPYSSLTASTEQDWIARASSGLDMVATAMTGWDQRPLIETPQPFYPIAGNSSPANYYSSGSAADIAAHISRLRTFTAQHPQSISTGIGLIYAWNELVEGGWLMPSFGPNGSDTSRLDALQTCLSSWTDLETGSETIIV